MTKYTTILHEPRIKHGLTLTEYVFLDSVYKLQINPKSISPNWCYAKREYLAEFLGVTKQTVLNLIDSCIKKGFLIKDETTKFLQVMPIWYSDFVCFTESKETLPEVKEVYVESKETLPTKGKETLPPYYNNSNYINNSIYMAMPDEHKKLFDEYLAIRKKLKYTLTDTVINRLLSKYVEFGSRAEIIENAIMGSWKDFYAPKQQNTQYDSLVAEGAISKELAATKSALDRLQWD